jgi:molecular chaperone DnaK (HSP70)
MTTTPNASADAGRSPIAVGIDLVRGRITIAHLRGGRAEILRDATGTGATHVHLTADGAPVVGGPDDAPGRTVVEATDVLGRGDDVLLDNLGLSAAQVGALVFRDVRARLEAAAGVGPRTIVLAVPASFGAEARLRATRAATLAGLEVHRVVAGTTALATDLADDVNTRDARTLLVVRAHGNDAAAAWIERGDNVLDLGAHRALTLSATDRAVDFAGLLRDVLDRSRTAVRLVVDADDEALVRVAEEITGRVAVRPAHRHTAGALGALQSASTLAGVRRGPLVLASTAVPLGIESPDGWTAPLIASGTTLPHRATATVPVVVRNGRAEIHLVAGDAPRAADNTSVGRLAVDVPASDPRPVVEVTADLDIQQRLVVTAEASDGRGRVARLTVPLPDDPDVVARERGLVDALWDLRARSRA